MKPKILTYSISLILLFFLNACTTYEQDLQPSPTEGTLVKSDMEEGSKREARRKWIELMHQSSEDVYWKTIEAERAWNEHHTQRRENVSNANISIANGQIIGKWEEKGSNNQAGSVIATTYDQGTDELYVVAAGGSLFKGKRDGSEWEVVNQDLRFNGSLLDFIDGPNGQRLIAFVEGVPAYSDDYGISWQRAENWLEYTDNWGNAYHPVISSDSQTIVTLAKPSYWSKLSIFSSTDGGETFQEIKSLNSHETNRYMLVDVQNSNDVLLIHKIDSNQIDIYSLDEQAQNFELIHTMDSLGFGEGYRANMICNQVNDSTRWMYFYDDVKDLYFSSDSGKTWVFQSNLPVQPWRVGIYSSPTHPEFLLLGAVECFRSHDGGQNWTKLNRWGEYYGNVESKLHADMMYFREFVIPGSDTFTAISNHGGMSLTYDQAMTTENIGLKNLNVSQYYSVKTDPIIPDFVYAGSQDQGFQKGLDQNEGPVPFNQTISGDYGHIVFSDEGRRLWTVYPGGWVICYGNPHHNNNITQQFTLDSEDETVWLPPLVESARTDKHEIFMAGGNINGGTGSHLIKLEVEGGELMPSQFEFDFQEASGGKISAIHNPIAAPNTFYVATTNGKFYYSIDYGNHWEQSIIEVPGSHYLYGASIISSKFDEDRIFVGGSGYSTAPVIFSFNGGRTFISMSNGLPPTTVFDLAMDNEENYLFAATEAGPYVCLLDELKWYPMAEQSAPNQTYWSVDYVPSSKTVRFGTYGRGIWDFVMEDMTSNEITILPTDWSVYPNPAQGFINIRMPELSSQANYSIMDNSGQLLLSGRMRSSNMRLDISNLISGVYFVGIQNNKNENWKKIIVE